MIWNKERQAVTPRNTGNTGTKRLNREQRALFGVLPTFIVGIIATVFYATFRLSAFFNPRRSRLSSTWKMPEAIRLTATQK